MPTTPNVENVKLGACTVMWGTDDLGYTKGGVDVSISTSRKSITVDQFGESDVNEYIMGRMVEVKVPMAESDVAKLALAIPGSVLVEGVSAKKLTVSTNAGLSLRSLAKKLILHPKALAAGAKNEDFVVLLAAPAGDMEFAFSHENERVYNVTFKGYADNTTGELFVFGDEAAVAI